MLNLSGFPTHNHCHLKGASLPGSAVVDGRSAFACANLRKNPKPSLLLQPMTRRELRTAALNAPAAHTPELPSASLFLRTKLLPPRPAPEILARPRLIERLRSNLSLPVTLVTANAGSGKTTLVADFLRKQDHPYVWYQLDRTDADPSVFLGYLAYGIRQQVVDFGDTMFAYLQQANELAQQPERAVDVLLNEILEVVEQQLIVVLDDYHHLGADTPVHAAVDRLIAYLPDVIHVIIISRDIPPLTLARLRSQDSLAIVY